MSDGESPEAIQQAAHRSDTFRRRARVAAGLVAVGGTLLLVTFLSFAAALDFVDRTWYRVSAQAQDRADVVRIISPWFRESQRDPPREWHGEVPSEPGLTSYRYATVFGLGFHVLYDDQMKVVSVIPTYE
ncbi:MAG: hypothetical protein FJX75_06550 [Armatimonadetes bacterium]|nr:hypothetical protein [Armatimonadota bacterium]